ncbi:MAG: ABC transporter permease [Chloroflexi bacterium]|nr:ABC transporter permease [Chloroflexota bacterium]
MTKFLFRRLIQAVPTFFGITFIVFFLINAVPGGPTSDLILADPNIKAEDVARIRASLGLDKSVPERYVIFLSGLMRGDLGTSLIQRGVKVSEMIGDRLPKTLLLTGTALALALLLAVPMGVFSAVKQYSKFDNFSTILSTAGAAIPSFWFAILMILIFAVELRWFPTGGIVDIRKSEIEIGDVVWHLVMPAFTLAFLNVALWNRYIRASMLEVIRQDYVRTARAKGLHERLVIFKHTLRNALIPFATLLGLSLPGLIGGALIIETIFSWPGMARLAFTAATQRDYPVIMGVVMMASVLTIFGNLLADIAYSFLDPRIKYS